MSLLTKVFTVLLVVFSIAFSTMAVSMVAQTTNWRETATKYEENARIADTNLRNMIAAAAAQEATARETIDGYLSRIGQLEEDLQKNGAEVARLRSGLAAAESEKSSTVAMNRALLSQLEMARGAEAEYRGQRERLDRDNIDLQQRNIDLNARVNELTSTVTVMNEQRRQFEQQINILRKANESLSKATGRAPSRVEDAAGAGLANIHALTPARAAAIKGKILAVSGNLVTLSVGMADGVSKDMVFVINRGADYVGEVKINAVNPNQSAGRITLSSLSPQIGDEVTDWVAMSGK